MYLGDVVVVGVVVVGCVCLVVEWFDEFGCGVGVCVGVVVVWW